MIQWTIHGTSQIVGDDLPSRIASGWLQPACPVSADGGRTWIPAVEAARRLAMRGDDGLAMLIPMRTATWATVGQYVGLFSLLFFGGPICFLSIVMASDKGVSLKARLIVALIAFVLGPLPVALSAWLGLREIKQDPTLRGIGRIVFAFVCAGIMGLAALAGMATSFVR